jgi:hypothetical protein
MRRPFRVLALIGLLCASTALARAKSTVLGVFLPTTMADSQQRFELAEKLAANLSAKLGKPVAARNFGRFEDFAKAAARGQLDAAVVDGWAAVQLNKGAPVAMAVVDGSPQQRWEVVSYRKGPVKNLSGKRLVVPRGAHAFDAKFVTNVMFVGDFDARHNFHLVSVPNVESALRLLAAKGAEAAVIPSLHAPEDARVLFKSAPLPGVVALDMHGRDEALQKAFTEMEGAQPIGGFRAAEADALAPLRQLLVKGPPRRKPVMAQAPGFALDTAPVVSFHDVGFSLPTFVDQLESPKEQPDD